MEFELYNDRITDPVSKGNETVGEFALRPESLNEYIGQQSVTKNLKIFIEAAKLREEALDHVLFYGPPGLGKTTLACIVAKEMKGNIRITSGPAIERAGDLAAILTNLKEKDILFIDEIHRLNRSVEEVLYSAMEDYALDIIIGKGPSARSIRIDLAHFTLIGATTRAGSLSAPLRERFGILGKFETYTNEELEKIIKRSAGLLDIAIDVESLAEIARRSRGTPRVANRLLRRVRDFAQIWGKDSISPEITKKSLKALNVDPIGLENLDREILSLIIERFNGGPVGIETISAAIGEERVTIEDVYEPFLIQKGFLHRTPKGRMVTDMAYTHLGLRKTEE